MIEQLGITFFSLIAVALSQARAGALRRWAPIFGLASQPFWFYTAYVNELWGIFTISFVYTLIWCRGAYNGWFWRE